MSSDLKMRLVTGPTVTCRVIPSLPATIQDNLKRASIELVAEGGGVAITTGTKAYFTVPFDCTLSIATLIASPSSSIVIDVWKCTYTQFDGGATHPLVGDSITGATPPTISANTKYQDSTLTGWTTALAQGDIIAFNVNSASGVMRTTLSLDVVRDV